MDKLLPALYKSYGTYVNKEKMIPSILDGLLPVQRRLLLVTFQTAKKWKKTAAILGETMARFHPHSEAIGTAENMVHNEFVEGGGSWGTRIGIEPLGCAAMRYTKMKALPEISNLAFKYIDHVPWVQGELDEDEPLSLPTMIPFCLMQLYESSYIAFGYRTDIPCYERSDLVKRLLFLIGKGPDIEIKPRIPFCKMLSGEFSDILTKGKGSIDIQGDYKINKSSKTIEVNGWSPRIAKFQVILNKIDKFKGLKLLTSGDIGFIDKTGKGSNTRIVFEVAKQRNTQTIFDNMVEAVIDSLQGTIKYSLYACDENKLVISASVDSMLITTYNNYKSAFEKYTQHDIKKLQAQIDEYQLIERIRPHISDAISVSNNDSDVAIQYLATHTSISIEDVKMIVDKYRIKRLMSISTDIVELQTKHTQAVSDLNNIDTLCIDHYNDLIN